MAQKRKKIQSIAGLVWKCIWLFFASICLAAGLMMFFQGQAFGDWMMCGFACSFPIIWIPLKMMFTMFRDGARQGARDYEVSVSSSYVTVQNHPFRTALVWLVLTTIFCLAVGPFILTYKIIEAIIDIVVYVVKLVKEKKKKNMQSEGKTAA